MQWRQQGAAGLEEAATNVVGEEDVPLPGVRRLGSYHLNPEQRVCGYVHVSN